MIFVTLGLEKFPFIRIFKWIDKLLQEKVINEDVIIQAGSSFGQYKCKSKKIIVCKTMYHSIMNKHINKASRIIIHAGVGSFLHVMAMDKIPIVIPRKHSLEEHIDDHQLDLAERLQKEYNIPYISTYKELIQSLVNNEMKLDIKSHKGELIEFLDNRIKSIRSP